MKRLLQWLVPQLNSPLVKLLLLANLAYHVGYLLPITLSAYYPLADADVYYMAGHNALHGQPLYPLTPQGDPKTPDGESLFFLYPPHFAAVLAPLGTLPQFAAVRLLKLATILIFWGFAAALCKLVTGKVGLWGTLGAGLVATITPGAYFNLIAGQVDPLLWLMLALALLTPATGAFLAASCLVKPFAAWPLALAALRRPRQVVPLAAATVIAGVLVGVAVCGWASYAAWLHYTPQRMSPALFLSRNTSLGLLPLRLLGWHTAPTWGRAFLMGMYVVGPGAVAWLTRRRPLPLQIAWVAVAAVLFAPFAHLYYLPVILTPLALELREALDAEAQIPPLPLAGSSPTGRGRE